MLHLDESSLYIVGTTYTKSKTIYIYIYEEANNPRCLMLYDMACKMAGVVDALNIQEIEFCPVYHPYLPQFLQLFLLKWLSSPSSFLSIHERYHRRY